jgi:hypothetical protein
MSPFAFRSILLLAVVCFYGLAFDSGTVRAWGWMVFNCAAGSVFLAIAIKDWLDPEDPS